MPISIGKLSLYVAGAGYVGYSSRQRSHFTNLAFSIRPESTVPICLDLGTNNKEFLEDPLYLGLRRERVPIEETHEFMEEFMYEMSRIFPKLLVQFEDFATDKVSDAPRHVRQILTCLRFCAVGFRIPRHLPEQVSCFQ